MFERFTDDARRVLVLAQEEARTLNHNYIGTEHILLGVIHESEGVAAAALESLGVSLDVVRAQVTGIDSGGGGTRGSAGDHVPFTPRAKKVLELRCARRCSAAPTTSAPRTSSWGCSARARVSPRRCSTVSA